MHKHHIIPKHLGGTDDPSNLIEVTVEEHAQIHYNRWMIYDSWQDMLAYKGLVRLQENCAREASRLANTGDKNPMRRKPDSHWSRNGKIEEVRKKINTPERAAKIQKGVQKLYDAGYVNPNKGKIWITNGSEEKYIKGDIPAGWRKGRLYNEKQIAPLLRRWKKC